MSKRATEAALTAYPDIVFRYQRIGDADGVMTGESINSQQYIRDFYQEGYEQAEKDLGWHSVKKSLPPVDKEVIVLTDDINGKIVPDSHRICYGHIVDKNFAVDL